jgi:hypothetical protein
LHKNLYFGDYNKDYKSEYVGEYKTEHAQNKVWDTTEGPFNRLSKENVLKRRTYSVGAAHIPACIGVNVPRDLCKYLSDNILRQIIFVNQCIRPTNMKLQNNVCGWLRKSEYLPKVSNIVWHIAWCIWNVIGCRIKSILSDKYLPKTYG